MANSAKMSKSERNLLTVDDAIEIFGTNETRDCIFDYIITKEDANFAESTANSIVLRVYILVNSI